MPKQEQRTLSHNLNTTVGHQQIDARCSCGQWSLSFAKRDHSNWPDLVNGYFDAHLKCMDVPTVSNQEVRKHTLRNV